MSEIALDSTDKNGMYKVYDKWPELAHNAYNDAETIPPIKNVSHIIFSGMGGSGTIGDIFSAILSKSNIHVTVVKGYRLPDIANENTLVISTSMSGNTNETAILLKKSIGKKCKIIAFSSGGKIEKICNENSINHCKVGFIHSPRASLAIVLFTIMKVLKDICNLDVDDIEKSIENMKKMHTEINSKNITNSNEALKIAKEFGKIPVIYYPHGLMAAAIRLKNSLQENAKMHVIAEDVIEACHNGIVGWENLSNCKPILLQGNDDHIKTIERWNIVKEFFEERGIVYQEIKSRNGGIITKLVNLIYLLDYSTIYKAVIEKTDPTPIAPIDFIKKRIQDKE
jgi:glucose/mannose-6-phosphate isomerase